MVVGTFDAVTSSGTTPHAGRNAWLRARRCQRWLRRRTWSSRDVRPRFCGAVCAWRVPSGRSRVEGPARRREASLGPGSTGRTPSSSSAAVAPARDARPGPPPGPALSRAAPAKGAAASRLYVEGRDTTRDSSNASGGTTAGQRASSSTTSAASTNLASSFTSLRTVPAGASAAGRPPRPGSEGRPDRKAVCPAPPSAHVLVVCIHTLDGWQSGRPRLVDPEWPRHRPVSRGRKGSGRTRMDVLTSRAWAADQPRTA